MKKALLLLACIYLSSPCKAQMDPPHICVGTCVDFYYPFTTYTSYQWYFFGGSPPLDTTANPQCISYFNPGSYTVMLIGIDSTGHSDTITLNNFVTVYPTTPAPNIIQSGDTAIADLGFVSYQWYLDSVPIPGATNNYYILTQSGQYYVVVTDVNDCQNSAICPFQFDNVNYLSASNYQFQIYPNPAVSNFTIRNILSNESLLLQILNPVGEIVYEENIYGRNEYVVNTSLASGIYFVKVNDVVRKLVVE